MTVKEFYETTGSDYEGVIGRLGSEALVRRFALKFLNDASFEELGKALEAKDGETAFRAAHTIKGLCMNLSFDRLYEVSAALTERLRDDKNTDGCEAMYQAVRDRYEELTAALRQLAMEE